MKHILTTDITKHIPNANVKIFSNDDKYFNAIIISDIFNDKDLVDRQKIIYDIIGTYIINKSIHAISFKTYTNDEWQAENKD